MSDQKIFNGVVAVVIVLLFAVAIYFTVDAMRVKEYVTDDGTRCVQYRESIDCDWSNK